MNNLVTAFGLSNIQNALFGVIPIGVAGMEGTPGMSKDNRDKARDLYRSMVKTDDPVEIKKMYEKYIKMCAFDHVAFCHAVACLRMGARRASTEDIVNPDDWMMQLLFDGEYVDTDDAEEEETPDSTNEAEKKAKETTSEEKSKDKKDQPKTEKPVKEKKEEEPKSEETVTVETETAQAANDMSIGFDINKFITPSIPEKTVSPAEIIPIAGTPVTVNPVQPPQPVPVVTPPVEAKMYRCMEGATIHEKMEALKEHVKFIKGNHTGDRAFTEDQIDSMLNFVNGPLKGYRKRYKANTPKLFEIPLNKYPLQNPDRCDIAFETPMQDKSKKLVIRFRTIPEYNAVLNTYNNDTVVYTVDVPEEASSKNKKNASKKNSETKVEA